MTKRLVSSWEGASFALLASLAWLPAWFFSCPRVSVESVSKAGVEITAEILTPGSITVPIEDENRKFQADDDRDPQEDDPEACGLPGLLLVPPSSLTLSQIASQESVSLFVLTPAQHPLRC